jgi:hypothetical protein
MPAGRSSLGPPVYESVDEQPQRFRSDGFHDEKRHFMLKCVIVLNRYGMSFACNELRR